MCGIIRIIQKRLETILRQFQLKMRRTKQADGENSRGRVRINVWQKKSLIKSKINGDNT